MSAVLQSERIQLEDEPEALIELSLKEKWGDGLPLVPPTDARIEAMLAATPLTSTDIIAELPPKRGLATVELVAVNAVMAGCQPKHLPLLIAAVEILAKPAYNGFGIAATTSGVMSMMMVNGPLRNEMGINYRAGCLGGAPSRSVAIGRALQLCLRNIGGMRVPDTSRSVFGQPGRLGGLCFGEWEERSEWPTLAERRGFSREQEVVTLHAGKGTVAVIDMNLTHDEDLCYLLGKSAAPPMSNMYVSTPWRGETIFLLNPMWAERLCKTFPKIESFQEYVYEHAWQPIDSWPKGHQEHLEKCGRVDSRGRVYAMIGPDRIQPIICGGLGNLHGTILPSWGESEMESAVTKRVAA